MSQLSSVVAKVLIYSFLLVSLPLQAAGEVQVDVSQVRNSSLKQGLLNGPNVYNGPSSISDDANTLISALKPTSWRFSGMGAYGYGGDIYRFVVTDYHYDTRFGTSTVQNLQDIFNAKYGQPITVQASCQSRQLSCFSSFESLRQAWNTVIRDFLTDTRATKIAYFDLLAESDLTFINVSPTQIYQLAKDAHGLVRQIRPEAKIVAPSNVSFKPAVYDALIGAMVKDGIRLDAVSWHELGDNPAVIGGHVAAIKSIFQKYPDICKPACPEIHISEYQGEDTTLIPGYAVGWLSNLESANVNQANRACWGGDSGSPIPYESCWYGFSGFLMPDRVSPQPLYWIYKFYADLNGSRFATKSTLPGIAVVSGPLANGSIGVLAGNYGTNQNAVQLKLVNFTRASARVDAYKIGNTGNRVVEMPNVNIAKTFNATPQNSVLTLQLDSFATGDAYWIVITPL